MAKWNNWKTECRKCGAKVVSKPYLKRPAVFDGYCAKCGNANSEVGARHWEMTKSAEEPEWKPGDQSSIAEIWGLDASGNFNISMRIDPTVMGVSKVGSVVVDASRKATLFKLKNKWVLSTKGGRKSGASVMGSTAQAMSKRPASPPAHPRQGEEWLHLWGDNLGGGSKESNFVAGSAAANTEMLVIEQAIACRNVKINVKAYCSEPHVAEYISYGIETPSGQTSAPFLHIIDATNRYFTKADYTIVDTKINDWLASVGNP